MASLPNYNPEDYKDDTELDLDPKNYVNYGRYHDVNLPFSKLAKLNIKRLAALSDAITRKYALNQKFKDIHSVGMDWTFTDLPYLNPTTLGNLAFIAMHNPGTDWEKYFKMLVARLKSNY